jgi:hypothetical protein
MGQERRCDAKAGGVVTGAMRKGEATLQARPGRRLGPTTDSIANHPAAHAAKSDGEDAVA